ncbi:DRBM domain-containing protein [Entamoeba marina]
MPRPRKTETDPDYLKKQKQASRSQEAALTNAILDFLITNHRYELTHTRTKGAVKTVKMIIPTRLKDEKKTYSQSDIRNLSCRVCRDSFDSVDTSKMTAKQRKRTEEAQLANGDINMKSKKTRPSRKTVRLIRVNSITDPNGQFYSKDDLIKRGTEFGKCVNEMMKNKQMEITCDNLKVTKDSFSSLKDALQNIKAEEDKKKYRCICNNIHQENYDMLNNVENDIEQDPNLTEGEEEDEGDKTEELPEKQEPIGMFGGGNTINPEYHESIPQSGFIASTGFR